jgi:hypothetical protein
VQEAKKRLLGGNSAILAVERGNELERSDELKRKEHERQERFRALQTVGASSFEQRWAGAVLAHCFILELSHCVLECCLGDGRICCDESDIVVMSVWPGAF